MTFVKKRKCNEDELIYSEDVGIDWKKLFDSGKYDIFVFMFFFLIVKFE